MTAYKNNILVIKQGALGDFLLSIGPFQAIRKYHKQSHITLLTTSPYVSLAKQSGLFNTVWSAHRGRLWNNSGKIMEWYLWNVYGLANIPKLLRSKNFARVYDLQTSETSSQYYRYFSKPPPEWSGIAAGCSHRHTNDQRNFMHTIDRQIEQLAIAGIDTIESVNLEWLTGDISAIRKINEKSLPTVLLIPGGSRHRKNKRWPAIYYAKLANQIVNAGFLPILIGTSEESKVMTEITLNCPKSVNLCGQTNLAQIASLARNARATIGNDTGPIHITASVGCPTTVLFSCASNPSLTAPRGAKVTVLECSNLKKLSVHTVWKKLELMS